MKTLITGGGGFIGLHLTELLRESGAEMLSVVAHANDAARLLKQFPGLSISQADIRRADSIREVVQAFQPDRIYHLAAVSSVPRSLREPLLTYETNVGGTLNILEAARSMAHPPRVLCFSTGQVYEATISSGSLNEDAATKPETPYAASKLCSEIIARQYHATWNIPVMIARLFNCIGPGQSPAFVCSDFARQIVKISLGTRPPLVSTGDLSRQRDFTDARDAARACSLILEHGKPGEAYNVCSGTLHSIREALDTLAELARVSITVETEAARKRAIDPASTVGNLSKLNRQTGWHPQIPFRQSLADLFAYWQDQLAAVPQLSIT